VGSLTSHNPTGLTACYIRNCVWCRYLSFYSQSHTNLDHSLHIRTVKWSLMTVTAKIGTRMMSAWAATRAVWFYMEFRMGARGECKLEMGANDQYSRYTKIHWHCGHRLVFPISLDSLFYLNNFPKSLTYMHRYKKYILCPESVSELYRPSDRRLSPKLVPTFANRSVVNVTDPYGRIFDFLDRSRYFLFKLDPELYSRGWVDPVPDPLLLRKSGSAGNRTRTSGSVARNSDH
jgi:hypothetical protein